MLNSLPLATMVVITMAEVAAGTTAAGMVVTAAEVEEVEEAAEESTCECSSRLNATQTNWITFALNGMHKGAIDDVHSAYTSKIPLPVLPTTCSDKSYII